VPAGLKGAAMLHLHEPLEIQNCVPKKKKKNKQTYIIFRNHNKHKSVKW